MSRSAKRMTKVAVAKIARAELWEFVAVTGYLHATTNAYGLLEGRDAVVVSGQLLRVTRYAQNGWAELLIGPEPGLSVWTPPNSEVEVELNG